MAEQEFPTLNGVEPSWSDISIAFPIHDGQTVKTTGIKSIKWSDKVEVGEGRGTSGGRKSRRSTGKYTCEATVEFYRTGLQSFVEALKQKNTRVSLVTFDVIILHTPPGETGIFTTILKGARLLGRSFDTDDESVDLDTVEVALDVMLVEDNGATLL